MVFLDCCTESTCGSIDQYLRINREIKALYCIYKKQFYTPPSEKSRNKIAYYSNGGRNISVAHSFVFVSFAITALWIALYCLSFIVITCTTDCRIVLFHEFGEPPIIAAKKDFYHKLYPLFNLSNVHFAALFPNIDKNRRSKPSQEILCEYMIFYFVSGEDGHILREVGHSLRRILKSPSILAYC